MAHRTGRDTGGSPPGELLTDLFVDKSEAAADAASQAAADAESGAGADDDSGCAADAQPTSPAPEARLQRIESLLETVLERLAATPSGAVRSEPAHDGADAAASGATAMPPLPEALVDDLKLAKSNLAGLSERVESLERKFLEKFQPIDKAAEAVRETTDGLAATGKKLEASVRESAWALSTMRRIEDAVETVRRYAFWWSAAIVVVVGVVAVVIGLELAQRHGLL